MYTSKVHVSVKCLIYVLCFVFSWLFAFFLFICNSFKNIFWIMIICLQSNVGRVFCQRKGLSFYFCFTKKKKKCFHNLKVCTFWVNSKNNFLQHHTGIIKYSFSYFKWISTFCVLYTSRFKWNVGLFNSLCRVKTIFMILISYLSFSLLFFHTCEVEPYRGYMTCDITGNWKAKARMGTQLSYLWFAEMYNNVTLLNKIFVCLENSFFPPQNILFM